MAERFKATVLKTVEVMSLRGFESHPLRQLCHDAEAWTLGTAGQGMGFGDVLDAGFQVFRSAFWQLALAEAIVAIPVAIIQALWLPHSVPGNLQQSVRLFTANAPISLLIGVLGILQMSAVIAVARQAAQGVAANALLGYRQALTRFPEALGFGLLYAVVVGIGLAIVVIPGIVVAVWLSQGIFLIVLGNRGIVRGIGESYQLVAGRFWRVLGIAIVAFLMVTIVSLLVTMLFTLAVGRGAVTAVVTTVVGILLGSFPLVTLYIQYRDLMQRRGLVGDGVRD